MHKCVLCPNTSSKCSTHFKPNVTFHTFPRNEQRRNRWIESLKLSNYSDWHRVCSEHFSSDDFRPGFKHMLWPSAIPKLPKIKIRVAPTDPRNSSTSTENNLNELNQNNQEVEQSNESSEDSRRNVAINDSVTPPRRSSRKIKPVIAPDGLTLLNESPDKKNQSDNKSSTLLNCNTPLQDLNISNSKSPMGESRCSVLNCKNNNANSKYSFFLYPKDEELKKIWIQNCRSESNIYSNGVYRVNSKVCGYHFNEGSFINPAKKNRLKKQAIPTLFVDYVVSSTRTVCNKKDNKKSDTNNFGIKEFLSLSIVIEPPHIQLNKEIHDKLKSLNVLVTSKNIHLYCCIPRCINSIEGEDKNVTVSLFRPAKEVVDDWSLVFGLNLTENSVLCERHFKVEDLIFHSISTETGELKIKTLISGAMPTINKPNERASKILRSKTNEGAFKRLRSTTNEELSVKKHKIQLSDESLAISEHVSPKKNEENSDIGPLNGISDQTLKQNNEPTDVHPTTSTDNCTSNSSQSSFQQVLPKILANSSLSITLQSNMKQNENVSNTDSTKVIDGSTNSKPTIQLNTDPATTLDIDPESNSSQPKIGQLLSKTQENSLSITLEHNAKHTQQISEINSNEVIDSTLTLGSTSTFKIEPNDENIIPTTSTNDVIPEYTAPIIEPVPSNISHNNSLSLALEPNNKQVSEIDVTKEVIPIGVIKIEPKDDDDDDDDDILPVTEDYTSNSTQLITNQISSNISFNESVSVTSIKRNKQIPPVKVSTIVNPTTISKPIKKLNTEPTNILPDNNMVNTLKLNLDQILSKNSFNSLSNIFNHNLPTTSANNCITNTIQPNIKQSELKSAATYKVSNKQSTNSKMYPNSDQHINQYDGSPIILDCISLSSSEDSLNYEYNLGEELNLGTNNTRNKGTETNTEDFLHMDVGFIRDISKKATLPNNFWKNLYSISQNTTIFIQQDEFLVPIKKIYFQNSLTPEIYINGKRYNYEKAVTSQLELENLLEKIDDIEMCFGYDGQFHENCIGYFEDTSDEEIEVCCNCRKFIKGTERLTIQNKLQQIEFLKNKLSKMEYRVIKARKLFQHNKRKEEISDIMKAINPLSFFNVMKHPSY